MPFVLVGLVPIKLRKDLCCFYCLASSAYRIGDVSKTFFFRLNVHCSKVLQMSLADVFIRRRSNPLLPVTTRDRFRRHYTARQRQQHVEATCRTIDSVLATARKKLNICVRYSATSGTAEHRVIRQVQHRRNKLKPTVSLLSVVFIVLLV